MRQMVEAEKKKIEKLKREEESQKQREKEQADFLLRQMRNRDEEASKMNSQELLYNKQLLDQIPQDI